MLSYEELLERAYSKIKSLSSSSQRFEIPRPQTYVIGSKTLVNNFVEICNKLNRNPQHVMKFLSKEMATAGNIEGNRAIFQGKFDETTVLNLLRIYSNRFVICPICKKPDTRLQKEKRFLFMVCEACGARSSIPT